MKDGWITADLASVSDINYGYTESASPNPIGPHFLRITDIRSDGVDWDEVPYCKIDKSAHAKFGLAHGDIVFARTGATTGKSFLVLDPPDAVFASYLIRLRIRDARLLPQFLFYYFTGEEYWRRIREGTSGSAQGGFNATKLGALKIPIPPVAEQKRIVEILDQACEALDTAETNIGKSLTDARELFDQCLNEAVSKGDSTWKHVSLADVCEIKSVLVDPREKKYVDLLHIGGANIVSKTGELIDLKTAKEEGLISGKFAIDQTMTLYSKIRPYLMKVARPDFEGLCSADIYPLSPKTGVLSRDFLFYILLSKHFTAYAELGSARAGMPKVNREHLFGYRFAIPDLSTQERIAGRLDALHAECRRLGDVLTRKSAALKSLRASILDAAFSGNLQMAA